MKTKCIFFLALISVLTSCDKNSVYSKLDKNFESNRWQSDDVKTFEFTLEEASKTYNLELQFTHIYDYQYESVPLDIQLTHPDGKVETIPFTLKIKDASGKQLADCTGDMCDLFVPLKENITLNKGTYKLSVAQSFQKPYLPNVLALGVTVKAVP